MKFWNHNGGEGKAAPETLPPVPRPLQVYQSLVPKDDEVIERPIQDAIGRRR